MIKYIKGLWEKKHAVLGMHSCAHLLFAGNLPATPASLRLLREWLKSQTRIENMELGGFVNSKNHI